MVATDTSIDPTWIRPTSVAEYHRMIDAGFFGDDERCELLEGVIVEMSPQEIPHATALEILDERLQAGKRAGQRVRAQLPLTLARSEPEPDLAVVTVKSHWPRGRHPETAHLVVEVAGDSLRKDLGVKAKIYAEAGITEYWVVDVVAKQVHVFTDPDVTAGVYRKSALALPGDTLQPSAPVPGVLGCFGGRVVSRRGVSPARLPWWPIVRRGHPAGVRTPFCCGESRAREGTHANDTALASVKINSRQMRIDHAKAVLLYLSGMILELS